MSELDRSSTDAMHWAEQFIQTIKDNNWSIDDIDEGLMVGWFANYWAAVHDPLQATIEKVARGTLGWAYADDCVMMDKGIDIRLVEAPTIIERHERDLLES